MLALLPILMALQSGATIPSPPVGMGPYQRQDQVPPPLLLTEVELKMRDAYGAYVGVWTITCTSSEVRSRIEATAKRFGALQPRLAEVVERGRGRRIIFEGMADLRNVYVPGCPPAEALDTRIAAFENAVSALDAALTVKDRK